MLKCVSKIKKIEKGDKGLTRSDGGKAEMGNRQGWRLRVEEAGRKEDFSVSVFRVNSAHPC